MRLIARNDGSLFSIGDFDKHASRYHAEVYQRKRREHVQKIHAQLHVLYLGQLKNLGKQAVAAFTRDLQDALAKARMTASSSPASSSVPSFDFGKVVVETRSKHMMLFDEQANGMHRRAWADMYSSPTRWDDVV